MKRPILGGLLVAIEGIDGAGKTTIAAKLAKACADQQLEWVASKEPTDGQWGQKIRATATNGRLSLQDELDLFQLDRQEHVMREILPYLHDCRIVILDRYYWSTAAYQGARGADVDQVIKTNEKFAPVPDLWILLDVDAERGLKRINDRGDKPNSFEKAISLTRARAIFCELAEQAGDRCRLVDATKPISEVFEDVSIGFYKAAVRKISEQGLTKESLAATMDLFSIQRPALLVDA